MIELVIAFLICIIVGKIAEAEQKSFFKWFFLTVVIMVPCALIPYPFVRFLLAGVIAYVAMAVLNKP